MSVNPFQPKSYHSATPYLIIKGAAAAIDFYKKVFSATEVMRMAGAGRLDHARRDQDRRQHHHARRGETEYGATSPSTLGGSPVGHVPVLPGRG